MPSFWSILINIDQDFFFWPKSQTLFQNNYYAESWSILIYIDQYWSILIRNFLTKVSDSVSKQLLWRFLINIDLYWSILINIDQYWSGFFFTKVSDDVSKQQLCRSWNIDHIDQYWSISIRTFLNQIHRLCFKISIMPSPDQYWSILINVDQDFSLQKSQTLFQNNYYADFSLQKSQTLFQNNYYAESWSI